MTLPLVSIILPIYNSELYIKECLDSIQNQTFKNWELIIINDGSNDSSELTILSFLEKITNPKIYIKIEHKGLPYCLNLGVENSNGKYIARMDADDIMLEDRLEKQVAFLEENTNIGVLGTNFSVINDAGKELGKVIMPKDNKSIKDLLNDQCPICHPTVMVKKELLVSNKYVEKYPFPEDYEIWLRLAKQTEFENLQIDLLKKRIHQNQVSQKTSFIYESLKFIYLNKMKDKKKLYLQSINSVILILMPKRIRNLYLIEKYKKLKTIKIFKQFKALS